MSTMGETWTSTISTTNSTMVVETWTVDMNISDINATSTVGTTVRPDAWEDYWEYYIYKYMNNHYLRVLGGLGFPGNIAAFVTLISMRPMTSSTIFMAVLACSDTCALFFRLLVHELTRDEDYKFTTDGWDCMFIYFFSSLMGMFSNWLIVLMTSGRFIAVWFPFKANRICTKMNTLLALLVLFVVLIPLNGQIFFTIGSVGKGKSCGIETEDKEFRDYWHWIDVALYAVVPCSLVAIFNILIIVGLTKALRMRRDVAAVDKTKENQQKEVARMLILVSVLFIILTVPNTIWNAVKKNWKYKGKFETIQYYIVEKVLYFMLDSNLAINFYLYFVTAARFRKALVNLITCKGNRHQDRSSYYTGTSVISRSSTMHHQTQMSNSNTSISHVSNGSMATKKSVV